MNLIVAVTGDWGIGKGGRLLRSIPEDMKFFREKTLNTVVLMGRATLESLPGGCPLKGRTNFVLSSDRSYQVSGAVIVHSLDEALEQLRPYDEDKIFIIGGASVYKLFLPYCKTAFVTKMGIFPEADKFFPNLDEMENWTLIEQGEPRVFEEVQYRFTRYENRQVKRTEE